MVAKRADAPAASVLKKIEVLTNRLREDASVAIAHAAFCARINDNKGTVKAFSDTTGAHGLIFTRRAHLDLAALVLTRMFDEMDTQTSDRASLPHLFSLLNTRGVERHYCDEARNWHPHLDRGDRDARAVRQALREAKTAYRRLREKAPGRQWLTAFRDYRNTRLAHSLVGIEPREQLLYGYAFDLLKEALPIVQKLQFAVLGNHWPPEDTAETWADFADAFFAVVDTGMKAVRRRERRLDRSDRALNPKRRTRSSAQGR